MKTREILVRGQVPRKQGLKHLSAFLLIFGPCVRGQVPRKQGLKQSHRHASASSHWSPRASSKKTRIETDRPLLRTRRSSHLCKVRGQVPRKQGLKLTSIFSSISGKYASEGKFQVNKDWNLNRCNYWSNKCKVRGQVPRKQGLKPNTSDLEASGGPSPRASSKKTRIETLAVPTDGTSNGKVRGQVPRKQGLKHLSYQIRHQIYKVRGQVPRKQGLKLNLPCAAEAIKEGPRASSKKTRIETHRSR